MQSDKFLTYEYGPIGQYMIQNNFPILAGEKNKNFSVNTSMLAFKKISCIQIPTFDWDENTNVYLKACSDANNIRLIDFDSIISTRTHHIKDLAEAFMCSMEGVKRLFPIDQEKEYLSLQEFIDSGSQEYTACTSASEDMISLSLKTQSLMYTLIIQHQINHY